MRWKNDAEFAIDLREDHVEMDGGAFLRHDHDDDVAHFGSTEKAGSDLIDRCWTRALAETEHDEVAPQGMYVTALERVVHATLRGPVVQNAGIRKLGVVGEQRLHDDG